MSAPWSHWEAFKSRLEPWRKHASFAHLFHVYPALTAAQIAAAEDRAACEIPESIQRFYRCTNGARLFGALRIYGSVENENFTRDPTRGGGQPVDLWAENILRPEGSFVFGGASAWSVRVKFAIWPTGAVRMIDANDVTNALKEWPSFDSFFWEEFDRLSALHTPDGDFIGTYADYLPPEARHLEKQKPAGRPS
ncbi:MAG: hypothetical protein ABUS57_09615 [Pseudomonadota bacterium]